MSRGKQLLGYINKHCEKNDLAPNVFNWEKGLIAKNDKNKNKQNNKKNKNNKNNKKREELYRKYKIINTDGETSTESSDEPIINKKRSYLNGEYAFQNVPEKEQSSKTIENEVFLHFLIYLIMFKFIKYIFLYFIGNLLFTITTRIYSIIFKYIKNNSKRFKYIFNTTIKYK